MRDVNGRECLDGLGPLCDDFNSHFTFSFRFVKIWMKSASVETLL